MNYHVIEVLTKRRRLPYARPRYLYLDRESTTTKLSRALITTSRFLTNPRYRAHGVKLILEPQKGETNSFWVEEVLRRDGLSFAVPRYFSYAFNGYTLKLHKAVRYQTEYTDTTDQSERDIQVWVVLYS